MLTSYEGLYAIIPTPAKEGAGHLLARDTVDLDETSRVIEKLIAAGAGGLITLGTTGECATLGEDDYRAFVDCVLDTVSRRIPVLVGTTALGGHQTASRMKYIRERRADGTLLGLPIWQPLTQREAVDWYASMSEAFPEIAIMVYANARAFRFDFSNLAFWEEVGRAAPTVTSAKMSRPKDLPELIRQTGGRINFMPNESTVHSAYALSPETTTACWATAAAMDPKPALAIMDAVRRRDELAVSALSAAIAWANDPVDVIIKDPDVFAKFNIQVEKTRIAAAGYCKPGPCRPPYDDLPADFRAAAEECGRRWAALCANDCKVPAAVQGT
jgi:dihydrodipicolinate synthase/N-acetylneuraminate lyase